MNKLMQKLAVVVAFALTATLGSLGASAADTPVKIGIIGTGKIGGTLARAWVKAGHEVFVSSRHPEELQDLVKELGPLAHAGTPKQAANFGPVVLVSIPYKAMPQIGADLQADLAGKVIIDTSNPQEARDGAMAVDALKLGAGASTAELLQNKRVVRAFNCISVPSLTKDAFRQPDRVAIPIGGDDAAALAIAQRLISDIGFEGVVIGSLARTRVFDLGQPLSAGPMRGLTAAQLRAKATELAPQ